MDGLTHIFTSAAFNYLGKVRALFRSVRAHHPEAVCHFVAVERHPARLTDIDREPFDEVLYADALFAHRRPGWIFMHSLVELATVIKPHVAAMLLARPDCARVIYLDPDIVLFSPLDDVIAALERRAIALTPHLLEPEDTEQGVLDNELAALKHGVFNMGFLAVANSPEGRRFVAGLLLGASGWAGRIAGRPGSRVHSGRGRS